MYQHTFPSRQVVQTHVMFWSGAGGPGRFSSSMPVGMGIGFTCHLLFFLPGSLVAAVELGVVSLRPASAAVMKKDGLSVESARDSSCGPMSMPRLAWERV